MLKDEEIIEKVRKTKLFNDKLKQDIIWYFGFLTEMQKNNLLQALNAEKIIIKNFLSSLKNKKIIKFEEIKMNIERLQNSDRKLKEIKEKAKDDLDIDNLLTKLELV